MASKATKQAKETNADLVIVVARDAYRWTSRSAAAEEVKKGKSDAREWHRDWRGGRVLRA